jgi:flagellar P-ring protein precursor FlgI
MVMPAAGLLAGTTATSRSNLSRTFKASTIMKIKNIKNLICLLLATIGILALAEQAEARSVTILRNICRVKGQEENVLHGLGLVVGLNGTGEANDPQTMRAIARALEVTGSPIPQQGMPGAAAFDELRKMKNVSLVWVTARIPGTGARRGDKIDCEVSAINGKSLAGGRLMMAAMQGPNIQDRKVYALAEGAINLDNAEQPMVGRIFAGCQLEEDVFTPFQENGFITLILDKNHANFQTATEIATAIRQNYFQNDEHAVQAKNASNIVVKIPESYLVDPVDFISNLLEQQVYNPEPESRVVINQRTGSIVIDGDVAIGDVVISHRNIVVEASQPIQQFSAVDQSQQESAKLQALVDALNALKVPNADAIEIIKGIDRAGKLHARLIVDQ